MKIECDIDRENRDVILLLKDNKKILKITKCNQNYFSEQLPTMIKELLNYPNINIKNIKFSTAFKKDKFSTTYRIFKSFVIGISS